MDALHSRLMYQLPEEPTAENIASIAEARGKVIEDMELEWERAITISWGEMLKQRPAVPKSRSG
jgi:hypothetical protein